MSADYSDDLIAPFPAFGGKRTIAPLIWQRLGDVKQYIEPFAFSAAVLLANPRPASLEVINDVNGFVANFWRAVKHQPDAVAREADYPVSHVDLGARHGWLMAQRERVGAGLSDPEWPGDARVAGWWLWGQCCWIGSGWCEWEREGKIPHASNAGRGIQAIGKIPHASNAGRGIQAIGKIPHASDAGRGIQAIGQIPHASNAGMGIQAIGQIPHASNAGMVPPSDLLTSSGRVAWVWLHRLAARLERVRVTHGDWTRCLNHHYGAESTGIVLDPPYRAYEAVYHSDGVADAVEAWAREHGHLRVVVCGHVGDYPTLDGWDCVRWKRAGHTYGGATTTDREALWFSPACLPAAPVIERQPSLFGAAGGI